jgi:uncharacterized protein YjeT (DUF2065 family)
MLPVLLVLATGIFIIVTGLRMLVNPKGFSEESLLYRYRVRRYFMVLSKETRETGKLRPDQIRMYGLFLLLTGIAGIVFLVNG